MTVRDLIRELQGLPPELRVVVTDVGSNNLHDVTSLAIGEVKRHARPENTSEGTYEETDDTSEEHVVIVHLYQA